MATFDDIIGKVRLRIREKETQFFSDDDLISLANDSLSLFAEALIGHECKLMMGELPITLVSGTSSYAIPGKSLIIPGNVFIDGRKVPAYDSVISEQLSYIETSSGITFYNIAGNDAIVRYWKTLTEITAVEDTVPLDGLWDAALTRALVTECKDIRKHDARNAAVLASTAFNQAISKSLAKHGRIRRYMRGSLNVS